ncbi:MAG: TonB-dependent receptor [Bacteroidales bacterium]|nr:TonB-dependent receptor [Bacteroidales bacterium]MDY6000884.1 TonB-dependent receptor [Candidatus Cryptobacteroides sp.]
MKGKILCLIVGLLAGLSLQLTGGLNLNAAPSEQAVHRISGKVVDHAGEPVIGAAILIKDATAKGTTTNTEGIFSLEISSNDVLVVSCIGYKSQEITPENRTSLEIVLEEDSTLLDETVVVGYGVRKKMNLSGSVATVNMDEILGDRPQPNVASALQGAIPGLYISSGSNNPGQTGKSIQIRGTASFSGSSTNVSSLSPLVLIDNVPGSLDALNPEDVESVTVLKDASASAIYGARAAAGVILITTKRPKQAQPVKINYNTTYGLVNAIDTPKQVNTETLLTMYMEAFNTTDYGAAQGQDIKTWLGYLDTYKKNPSDLSSQGTLYDGGIFVAKADGLRYYLQERDSYKSMIETGSSWNNNLSVSGGSDRIRFRMSANSYSEDGPLWSNKDSYWRNAITTVVSADITDWFTQELDVYYTKQKRKFLSDQTGSLYGQRNPDFLPDGEDPDGILLRTPKNIISIANTARTLIEQPRIFSKSIFRPLKGLEAVLEYTYQKTGTDYTYFSGKYSMVDIQLNNLRGPDHDFYIARRFFEDRNSLNAYATYTFEPWKDHHLSIMGGFNQEKWNYEYYNTRAEDQTILSIPSMSNAQGQVIPSDSYHDYALRSGFFRFNYDYAGKYILEVSGRYDGSSKFPKNSRFGFFPSFSVAWNVGNENFMQGTKRWLNQLKPRFSYGSIGNQSSVGYYDYISAMSMNTKGTVWFRGNDEDYVTTIGMPDIVSNDFTWETITTTNVGLDFSMLGNKLTGTFEYFRRDTKDILSESVAMPSVLGTTAPMQNVGAMRTSGWEFQINWRGQIGPKVSYRLGFNIWDYTSKVTKLNFNEEKSLSYLYVGKKVGEIWGYEYDGFYTVDDFSSLDTWTLKDGVVTVSGISPRPGDYKYKNLNDGQYGSDPDADVNDINSGKNAKDKPGDMKVIGNTTPRYQYGLNFGVSYAGFDLSVMLQGVGKRDYFSSSPYFYTYVGGSESIWFPVFKGTTDYWRPISTDASSADYYVAENPDAKLPRVYGSVGNSGYNRRTNTRMLQSAAYLRVKNVTLSYTFPKVWMQKVKIDELRAYVSCENMLTFDSLPNGIDPETLNWSYPLYRTVSFGLNLTF